MNAGKLVKQLRREVAAHPQKAAALGLMLAVALYLWGPLLWGWVKSGASSRAERVDMTALILTDDPVDPSQAKGRAGRPSLRWEKIRPLLAQEPLHRPATWEVAWVDPFAPRTEPGSPAAPMASDEDATAGGPPETARLDVEKAFVLTSVLIGPRRRLATINGDTFAEGDTVVGGQTGSGGGRKVRVARIFRDGVELEDGQQRWQLQLSAPSLAQGDDWSGGRQDAPR